MLLTSMTVDPGELRRETGWEVKPEGACKGEICVPLPGEVRRADGMIDASVLAARLGMSLMADSDEGLWALGPSVGITGRALSTALAPDLELPTVDGQPFRLSSLRGRKVALISWASW